MKACSDLEERADSAYDRTPTLRSRELRNNATSAERKLWRHLNNRKIQGVRFNRQVPVGPFICDFVARTEDFKALARDLAVHIAATNPLAVRIEDLPPELIQRERQVCKDNNVDVIEKVSEKALQAVTAKILKEVG